MSHLADGRMWADVLNLGGYDLLMKPLDPVETLRVLGMAAPHRDATVASASSRAGGRLQSRPAAHLRMPRLAGAS